MGCRNLVPEQPRVWKVYCSSVELSVRFHHAQFKSMEISDPIPNSKLSSRVARPGAFALTSSVLKSLIGDRYLSILSVNVASEQCGSYYRNVGRIQW